MFVIITVQNVIVSLQDKILSRKSSFLLAGFQDKNRDPTENHEDQRKSINSIFCSVKSVEVKILIFNRESTV